MDNLEAYKNEGHAGQVGHGLALVLGGRLLRVLCPLRARGESLRLLTCPVACLQEYDIWTGFSEYPICSDSVNAMEVSALAP